MKTKRTKITKSKAPICECGKTMIEYVKHGKNLFFCDNDKPYNDYKPHKFSFKKGK